MKDKIPQTSKECESFSPQSGRTFMAGLGERRQKISSPLLQAILFFLIIAVSTIGGGGFIYHHSQQALIQTTQKTLLSLAELVAYLTDVEQLQKISHPSQKGNDDYKDIQNHHLAVLAAYPELAYIYTLTQKEDGKLYFITDTQSQKSEKPDDTADVMEPYEETTPLMWETLTKCLPKVETTPSVDKWGEFLSAYAPLKNEKGNCFGIVGVDISLEDYRLKTSKLETSFFLLLFIGLVTAGFTSFMVWDFARKKVHYDKIRKCIADVHDIYVHSKTERREKVFCMVLQQIVEITESKCGFISEVLCDESGSHLKVYATCHLTEEEQFSQRTEIRDSNPLLEKIIKEKTAVFENSAHSILKKHTNFPCGQSCLKSYMSIPVLMGEEVIALIWVSNTSSKYSNKTLALLRPLVDSFASTIDSIKAGDLLLMEKEHSDHILNSTPALIVGLTPSGITRFINPAVSLLTGYTEGELIRRDWWSLMHPEEDKGQISILMDFFSRDIKISDYEMVLTTKTGNLVILLDVKNG